MAELSAISIVSFALPGIYQSIILHQIPSLVIPRAADAKERDVRRSWRRFPNVSAPSHFDEFRRGERPVPVSWPWSRYSSRQLRPQQKSFRMLQVDVRAARQDGSRHGNG